MILGNRMLGFARTCYDMLGFARVYMERMLGFARTDSMTRWALLACIWRGCWALLAPIV